MNSSDHQKITYLKTLFIYVLAVAIPFKSSLIPVLIGGTAVCWLLNGNYTRKFKQLFSDRYILIPVLFYLLHVVGMLWSENTDHGRLDLEIKLSMIVLPLILITGNDMKTDQRERVVSLFMISCVVSLLICLINAALNGGGVSAFYYKELSIFIHPGYFSMYLNFALAVSLFNIHLQNRLPLINKATMVLLACILIAGIILLASKSGIILMILIMTLYALSEFRKKKLSWKHGLVALVILVPAYFLADTSGVASRIKELKSVFNSEQELSTTGMRLQSWQSGIQLLSENLLFGVGTGDVKDELIKKYNEMGFHRIAELKLNTHNQYLQTGVAFGVFGLAFLFYMIMVAIRRSLADRNIWLFLFMLIISFTCLTESIMEVQAGIVFFMFFYCMLSEVSSRSEEVTYGF